MAKPSAGQQDVRMLVQQKQKKSKQYMDKCRGAKLPKFQCGSFVRVRSKFSQLLKIIEQKGLATYKLSDGKVWNAVHLAPAFQNPNGYVPERLPGFDDYVVHNPLA